MTLTEIADKLIDWAVNEPRVRALWIEGGQLADLRRPYRALRLHLAADEPVYAGLAQGIAEGLAYLPTAKLVSAADTPRFTREFTFLAGDQMFTLIAEQSYLLAKRPRVEVIPLVDKTGHLTHVLDFSGRKNR